MSNPLQNNEVPVENSEVDSLLDQLNYVRVLAFVESAPQSNRYHQIMLTKDHFKKVSEALVADFPLNKEGYYDVETSDEAYELPEHLETCKSDKRHA